MVNALITPCMLVSLAHGQFFSGTTTSTDSDAAKPPSFDPSMESVTFGNQTFNFKGGQINEQFEAYLASSSVSEEESTEYRKLIDETLRILNPATKQRYKIRDAYATLLKASSFREDDRIGDSVCNAIYLIENARSHGKAKIERIAEIDEEIRKLRREISILESKSGFIKPKYNKDGKIRNSKQLSAEFIHKGQRLKDLGELRDQTHKEENIGLKEAQAHFQGLLVQLYVQRRFEHVLIGCGFNHLYFPESIGAIELKNGSETSDFFTASIGSAPTVDGLEALSQETKGTVTKLIEAFESELERNRIDTASRRLLEAFAIGEHLGDVQTISFEKKQRLFEYASTTNKIKGAMDGRNFVLAQELNETLKEMTDDYNSAKVDSAITSYTSSSNNHVSSAWKYAIEKDLDSAEEEISIARELWPNNPKIKDYIDKIEAETDSAIKKNNKVYQAQKEFDQAFSLQDFSFIMQETKAIEFASIFTQTNDQERFSKFNRVKTSFTTMSKSLKTAEVFIQAGQNDLAWEHLYVLDDEYKSHTMIRSTLEDLEANHSNFISQIKLANHEITSGNYGTALSLYLSAKQSVPQSTIATEAIQKIIDYKTHGKRVK